MKVKQLFDTEEADFYKLCSYGKKSRISSAIKNGASVNALSHDGYSPLFHAVLGINPEQYTECLESVQEALSEDNDDKIYAALSKAPCCKGNFEGVSTLLNHGANLRLKDRNDGTVFVYAALFCTDVRILKILVESGANTREIFSANYSQPLINFASFINTSPECISYIAELEKNVGERNLGTTPIMWAAMYNSNPKVIDALIDAGADINASATSSGYTPLHWAIRCNRNDDVAAHIIKLGADINKKDKYGSTPLLWAVCNSNPKGVLDTVQAITSKNDYSTQIEYLENLQQTGKPRLIPLLLERKPEESSVFSAYELAYIASSAKIANLLLDEVSKLNKLHNVSNSSEILQLMGMTKDEAKINALKKVLVKSGNLSDLNKNHLFLLIPVFFKNPNVLNICVNDFKMVADYEIIKTCINHTDAPEYLLPLIKACDNINRQDSTGQTLLHYAVSRGRKNAVRLLLENGAKIDMRYGDSYLTELLVAVSEKYPDSDIINALLDFGADINARDKDGATVLMYAVNKNYVAETVALLLNRGADRSARYKGSYVYEYCNDFMQDSELYPLLQKSVSNSDGTARHAEL